MSLLTICQDVAREAPVAVPLQVVGSSDDNAQLLLACAQAAGKHLGRRHNWTAMVTEYTLSTVAAQADYSLPSDYRFLVDDTIWDRTNYEKVRGPLSPQEWQQHKSSVLANTVTTWKRYRIRNVSGTRYFSIDPTPDSADSMVFEYLSENWCESSGGTGQTSWEADTDVGIVDEYLLYLETKWRFLRRLGMDYDEEYQEAMKETGRAIARDGGMPVLMLNRRRQHQLLGPQNVPDTGYGS